MSLPIFTVDAFTHSRFSGNPAAVVLLPTSDPPLSTPLRQSVAAEMNLAETAFIEPVSGCLRMRALTCCDRSQGKA
jgi:PhzF family phenazine biosynthesis protein